MIPKQLIIALVIYFLMRTKFVVIHWFNFSLAWLLIFGAYLFFAVYVNVLASIFYFDIEYFALITFPILISLLSS